MSNNYRPQPALPQGQALAQDTTNASLALDPTSVPLPPDDNDLFDLYFQIPEDDEPQGEVSTSIANHVRDSAGIIHNEDAHTGLEVPPETTNTLSETAEELKKLFESFKEVTGISFPNTVESLDSEESKVISLASPEYSGWDWNDPVDATTNSTIPPVLAHESSSENSFSTAVTPSSQPMPIPAHISLQDPVAPAVPTITPNTLAAASFQFTADAYTQQCVTDVPSSLTAHSEGLPESLASGPVVKNNLANNSWNGQYPVPHSPVPQQPQLDPGVNTSAPLPTIDTRSTAPTQQPAQTRASTPSRGATQKNAQGSGVSSFKPTRLNQYWTSSDLEAQGQTNLVATTSSSQAQTPIRSFVPIQAGPPTGAGHEAPSHASPLAFGQPPSVTFQSGPTTHSHYRLAVAPRSRVPAPDSSSQPQGPVAIDPRLARHGGAVNGAAPVQRAYSDPQLQATPGLVSQSTIPNPGPPTQPSGALQVNSAPSPASIPASVRANAYAPPSNRHAPLTRPLGRTGSSTSTQAPYSTQPSALRQPVTAVQSYGPSVPAASPRNLVQLPTQSQGFSNSHTRGMLLTPKPSPTEAHSRAPAQRQTAGSIQAQASSQIQQRSGPFRTYTLEEAQERWGSEVTAVWSVRGDTPADWSQIVMIEDRPYLSYPIRPPPSIYMNSNSQLATPAPVQQQTAVQAAPAHNYEAPQQAHDQGPVSPRPPVANDLHELNTQRYMHPPSMPVQRSYSSPSLTTPAQELGFTVTAPPSAGFMPIRGSDHFSTTYWQQGEPKQVPPSYLPRQGSYIPPPPHTNRVHNRGPIAGPSSQSSTSAPHPATSAHVHAHAHAHGFAQFVRPSPNPSGSGPSSSSRSRSSASSSSHSPAVAPQNANRKRRASNVMDADDDEIQEISPSEYNNAKGKRARF